MALHQCQQCGRKFKYPHQLRKHRRVHSMMNRTTYRCKICSKAFTFLSSLRQHLAQHFNYKSGENLYIDDLAIGVTIEPVDEPNCGWSSTPQSGKRVLGPARESPEGQPCYCLPSDSYGLSFCGPMYPCGECPRHYSRSQCFSYPTHCIGHQTNTPCYSFNPQTNLSQVRCGSTHHVNPQLVLHVDTTHDTPIPFRAPEKASTSQDKSVSELSARGAISNQYAQVCSRRCVPIRSATVSRYEDGYDADSDPAEDITDSDRDVFLQTQDKVPVIYSQSKKSILYESKAESDLCPSANVSSGNNADSLGISSEVSTKMSEDVTGTLVPRLDTRSHKNGQGEMMSERDKHVQDSRKSFELGCAEGSGKPGVEEMEEFDDEAALNDLSTFFPQFNDNQTGPQSEPDVGTEPECSGSGIMDTELNSEELLLRFVEKDKPVKDKEATMTEIRTSGESAKGNELLDIEACVKNGLDSKAINPTVVVNDLQNDIDLMSLACMRKDGDRAPPYACYVCKITCENKASLSNHLRSKSHLHERDRIKNPCASSCVQKRGPGRPTRKCTQENPNPVGKTLHVSPRCSKTFPVPEKDVSPKDGDTEPEFTTISEFNKDLESKMARAATKRGYQKKIHHGPQLRATVQKLNIKCYICRRDFTSKQHFIVHAKDHLKKLGYADSDVFYCTICYAFYPCENDLRSHLIDKHASDDLSTGKDADQENSILQSGNQMPAVQGNGIKGCVTPKYYAHRAVIEDCQEQNSHFSEQLESSSMGSRKDASPCDSDGADSASGQVTPWDSGSVEYSQADRTMNSSHSDEQLHSCICHVCGETLGSLSLLRVHLKVHENVPLKSRILSEQVKGPGSQVRSGSSGASCKTTFSELKGSQEKISCQICGRPFRKTKELDNHMQVHNPRRQKLRCPLCRGECLWKSNFRCHLLRHATPVGQSFNTVKFNPNSKILCPFCGKVDIFYDAQEFRQHMLQHVNKILAEECSKTDNYAPVKKRKQPMEETKSASCLYPNAGQYGSCAINEEDMYSEKITSNQLGPTLQKIDSKMVPAKGHTRHALVCDDQNAFTDRKEDPKASSHCTAYPPLSAGMTSTPNPYDGLPDPASSIDSVDTSPGGSLRGNSGLFVSPEWVWPSPSPKSSGMSGTTDGSYTNINTQRKHGGSSSQSPFKRSTDSMKSVKSRPELNDSGFIQTCSGESDNGETVTAQSVPQMSSTQRPVQSDMCKQSSSMSCQEEDQEYTSTKYNFLSLARVSELMTTTVSHTSNFLTVGVPCGICRRFRLNQANVKQHLFTHFDNHGRFDFVKKDGKHECPICEKMVSDRRSATAHLFSHWGASVIRCPVCDRPFNLVKTMRMHVKKIHPNFVFSADCYRRM